MASLAPLQSLSSTQSPSKVAALASSRCLCSSFNLRLVPGGNCKTVQKNRKSLTIVSAVGDVSAEGTNYLIAGAATVALLGTAFPIIFSRKDLCPECDGAGFVRETSKTLSANAARKDLTQIVCTRCNGLGKLGQIDK
ncbi:transmembrane protein [Thalictrum thalictroides]|uniref:Transmembrane protein n=1 Tax=Thalictrum thalictroides TaxID=46969 RepID=A0A7J6X5A8_THATH|nr:transmembrane protein [Thalictrum thalictroides]